jgi:hypothetical protein
LRHQSLQPHAPGSSPQHVRSRRHRVLAQKRNDPTKSHCARRIKSLRTRDGHASHSSSVSRPGKLRAGRRRAPIPVAHGAGDRRGKSLDRHVGRLCRAADRDQRRRCKKDGLHVEPPIDRCKIRDAIAHEKAAPPQARNVGLGSIGRTSNTTTRLGGQCGRQSLAFRRKMTGFAQPKRSAAVGRRIDRLERPRC